MSHSDEVRPLSDASSVPETATRRRGKRPVDPVLAETASEPLLRATINALSAHIAVLDADGTIIAVNKAWRRFAKNAGLADPGCGMGTNYLRVCARAAPVSPEAAATAKALREILRGRRREFRIEYPCAGPAGTRWFQLRITPFGEPQPARVVMAHEDITEAKHAEQELARLSARLLQLQDDERRQIAGELHDTTAQNLLAITLNLARLREQLRDAPGRVSRILTETLGLAEQSLQEIRTLSYLLHPPLLDEIGLASALKWYADGFAERSGIAVQTDIDDLFERLPGEIETALFRVVQEALSNIHRHSGSPCASVALYRDANGVTLEIGDHGTGFAPARLPGTKAGAGAVGVGISGMRLRLRQLGGQLDIRSDRSGTRVTAYVPVSDQSAAGECHCYTERPAAREPE